MKQKISQNLISDLYNLMESCILCPHECEVNRRNGETGICRTLDAPYISSATLHFGEEKPLVAGRGSGTIFFTGCNLECVYCQNYDISQLNIGHRISTNQLAGIMMDLQNKNAANINLVTPTHQLPMIVDALRIAFDGGLDLPIVYNCGGYESVQVIKMLDGIIDIYMPDIKYSDNENAEKYSGASDYIESMKEAVKEMYSQTGDLKIDSTGQAIKGLLIRHLILPNDITGSAKVLQFIHDEISPDSYVNIMNQYRPCFKAKDYDNLNSMNYQKQYFLAVHTAQKLGLTRGLE